MTGVTRRTVLGAAAVVVGTAVTTGGQAAPASAGGPLPVPDSGALLGAFVKHDPAVAPGNSEPETLETVAGRTLDIDHSFQHWGWALPSRIADDIARGRVPLLSWGAGPQATLAQTALGTNDDAVKQQARTLRDLQVPVLMRFTWEMDLPQRGYDPTTFKAAWQRVRGLFTAEGATNVSFVWCPTWLAYQTGRASSFWPGDSYVDWVAADGYARPTNDHASLVDLFQWFYDFGQRHSKPMMIAEAGVNDTAPGVQAAWLTQARDDLKTALPLIRAFVYFDSLGSEDTDWIIEGDPDAEAAFRAIAQDPYFGG